MTVYELISYDYSAEIILQNKSVSDALSRIEPQPRWDELHYIEKTKKFFQTKPNHGAIRQKLGYLRDFQISVPAVPVFETCAQLENWYNSLVRSA